MVTIAQLESWQPDTLATIADDLNTHRGTLVDLNDEVRDARPPSSWVGADSFYAEEKHDQLAADIVDDVAEIAAVINALDTAEPLIRTAKEDLAAALSSASGWGFEVDRQSGRITDNNTYTNRMFAEEARMARTDIATDIGRALQVAADADADLAGALNRAEQHQVDVSGDLSGLGLDDELRGRSPEEVAEYLLDHPERAPEILPILSDEEKQALGEGLAERTREAMDYDQGLQYDPERAEQYLATLNAQMDAFGLDPVVSTAFLEDLGPAGLLEFNAFVPTLQLDDNFPDGYDDDRPMHDGLATQMGALQRNLGEMLDAGTAGLTGDGQPATDSHVSSEWVQQLVAQGDDRIMMHGLTNHYGTHQMYGYQLMAPLLHSVDNGYLLNEVGDGMLTFETTYEREHGVTPWSMPMYDEDGRVVGGRTDGAQWSDGLDGLRLDWTQGTGEDDPAGFDPMGALLDGLSNNPQAARDFFTGDPVSVEFWHGDDPGDDSRMHEISRVDYLLTDREWMPDHASWSQVHNQEAEGPSNIGYLGDSLRSATMEAPPDEATRHQIGDILDEMVHSVATDEQARGHDNRLFGDDDTTDFAHTDIIDPALRDDLGQIFAYHSETMHETFVGGDNDNIGPYGTSFDEGEFRLFLSDLGKDPDANEYLRVAEYEEAVRQLKGELSDQRTPTDAVNTHMDALGQILGATDYGAAVSDIAASEDSDSDHNQTTSNRADFARDIVGLIPTGKSSIVGFGFDALTGGLIDAWEESNQVDHSGDRDYDSQTYLNGRRLMAESLAEETLLSLGYTQEQANAAAATGGQAYTSGVSQSRGAR